MRSRGLRRESRKHAAEATERRDLVERVRRRDGYRCQARDLDVEAMMLALAAGDTDLRRALDRFPRRCDGPLDVHERIPRSAWRAGYLVDDNCLLVCRSHHDWIDDEPDAAHELKLHGYSWEVQ